MDDKDFNDECDKVALVEFEDFFKFSGSKNNFVNSDLYDHKMHVLQNIKKKSRATKKVAKKHSSVLEGMTQTENGFGNEFGV